MSRLPWITTLVAAFLALNPVGLKLFDAAFLTGEQLSRNIWGPLYLTGMAILVALALIEWYVRLWIARRRASPMKKTET